jgi:quinohemoprotein ethanol dehydrogenase
VALCYFSEEQVIPMPYPFRRPLSLLTGAFCALFIAAIGRAQPARQVDDDVLKTGSPTGAEWLSYGVNWSEQRYSPLSQINVDNVSRLGLVWSYDIPAASGNPQVHQEGTPLVFNGVLYSIGPWSVVYAVDLHTGKEIWHQDPDVNQQIWQSRICCGVVNRGIAIYKGRSSPPWSTAASAPSIPLPANPSGKPASRPRTCATPSPWPRASSRAARSSSV